MPKRDDYFVGARSPNGEIVFSASPDKWTDEHQQLADSCMALVSDWLTRDPARRAEIREQIAKWRAEHNACEHMGIVGLCQECADAGKPSLISTKWLEDTVDA
jgi:hypothetical protein